MQKYKMPIRLRIMVCLIECYFPMCMFAQQITVQGVVKDQTEKPLSVPVWCRRTQRTVR